MRIRICNIVLLQLLFVEFQRTDANNDLLIFHISMKSHSVRLAPIWRLLCCIYTCVDVQLNPNPLTPIV